MIDTERLIAFALVTSMTSLVPGPSMVFVMSQAIWRGPRAGALALLGMQIGYVFWWVLAGLGLGTLARAYPFGFRLLAIGGALYLAWLGVQAIRHARELEETDSLETARPKRKAFREGVLVAIGNPKSLIYIVALLPPFVDLGSPVVPQLIVLAILAALIDLIVGAAYIIAGHGLSRAMTRPGTRKWIDRSVGMIFILIAAGILVDLLQRPGSL